MKKRDWLNLPNALTAVRILLVPALLIVFFKTRHLGTPVQLCLILVAGLTDCLDGFFARKYGCVTDVGKVLDPIADKLMTAAVVLCLAWMGVIGWYVLAIVAVKEAYMGVGAALCLKNKIEVASDIYGKAATVIFYPAVLLAWPWHGQPVLAEIGRILMYISVALSLLAAVHYTLESLKRLRARST